MSLKKSLLVINIVILTLLSIYCNQTLAKETKDKTSNEHLVLKEKVTFSVDKDSILGPLTLNETIDYAIKNYPSIHAAQSKVSAAKAGIGLAKTAYLPKGDAIYQTNRATRNNITGLLFPQSVIPNISGPAIANPNFGSAWGTATGGLVSWELLDFGLKRSKVNLAKTDVEKAESEAELTELELASKVADTFFRLLAAQEALKAVEANVERAKTFSDSVNVLAKNGLRPGADASRALAEVAVARTQLAQAKQLQEVTRAYLAQLLGVAGKTILIKEDRFLNLPSDTDLPIPEVESHPILKSQKSNIDLVESRKKVLFHSYFPKLNAEGALFGRGSGVDHTGDLRGGANGLFPTRLNFAGGITANLPLFEWTSIRAKQKIEKFNEEVETAKYNELVQEIIGKFSQAKVIFESAGEIAKEAKTQLEAAKISEVQTTARFKAGLGTVIEVADTQRLLTKSEIEDSIARLSIWQALLNISIAQGDIKPFLALSQSNGKENK